MDRNKFLGDKAAPSAAPAAVAAPAPEAPPRPHRSGRRPKAEGAELRQAGEHKILSMPARGQDFPKESMAFTVGDAVDRCREEVRQAIARMARMVECFGAAGVLPEEWAGITLQQLDMCREAAEKLPAFEAVAEAIRSK